ncbi:hypothetical protein Bca52824_008777 [Brassica carinata]|uniref:Uncharacterized protein n=1 Tax=Brassica carinata TaxID=52824 RepID=A0A8X8B6D2_BRACI|nr:hypothetical protein Bca52824_008777 [Brassica carinata]
MEEDKGKGLDEENSLSVSEGGPSNMEVDGSDDNYDDDDESDEGDESDEAVSGIPTTFEYEPLAEKKRKALQRDGSEKRGKYDAINNSKGFKELFFTGRRRRRRKNKKRGRRQGWSNKQVSPEILKRLSEALILHADHKDSEAFPILVDIIEEAPAFNQAYYYLALVPDSLGKPASFYTEALKSAAFMMKRSNSKSHVWELLTDRAK